MTPAVPASTRALTWASVSPAAFRSAIDLVSVSNPVVVPDERSAIDLANPALAVSRAVVCSVLAAAIAALRSVDTLADPVFTSACTCASVRPAAFRSAIACFKSAVSVVVLFDKSVIDWVSAVFASLRAVVWAVPAAVIAAFKSVVTPAELVSTIFCT